MVRPVGVMLWASSHMTRASNFTFQRFSLCFKARSSLLRSPRLFIDTVIARSMYSENVKHGRLAWVSREEIGRQWQIGLSRHASLAFNRLLYNTQTPHQTARERKRRWRDVDGMERRCHQLETEMKKKKLKCENERDKFESCETFT